MIALSPKAALAPLLAVLWAVSVAAHAAPATAQEGDEVSWDAACPQKPPGEYSTAERDAVWDTRQNAEPLCLLIGSIAWAEHDKDKASQLYRLGMLRRYYDLGRCVTQPHGPVSSMMMVMRMQAAQALGAVGAMPDLESAKVAARDPSTFRYRTDHLETMCEGPVQPADKWDEIREKLQSGMEAAPAQ